MPQKVALKVAASVFFLKVMFSNYPKVTKCLGYFYQKMDSQKLSKILQSGHTDSLQIKSLSNAERKQAEQNKSIRKLQDTKIESDIDTLST